MHSCFVLIIKLLLSSQRCFSSNIYDGVGTILKLFNDSLSQSLLLQFYRSLIALTFHFNFIVVDAVQDPTFETSFESDALEVGAIW